MQRQVDELDDLKAQHYQEIIEHEEEVWDVVQGKACVVVRSTLDVFDRFTAKASDPVIEPMLQSVPDPFDSYGQPSSDDQIFSILPPFSIMANVPSTSPSPITGTPQTETADVFSTTSTSWTQHTTDLNSPNVSPGGPYYSEPSSDWADATSPSTSPPPSGSTSPTPRSPSPSRKPPRPISPNGGRRTESKLRSVLSVIDEAAAAGRPAGSSAGDASGASSGSNDLDITGASSGTERSSGASWATFPFGTGIHSQAGSQQDHDTTPRVSAFYDIGLPPPETPERNRSPQSDETAIPA